MNGMVSLETYKNSCSLTKHCTLVTYTSDIHYETHYLELKYLKVSVQTLIWVLKDAIIVLLETIPCPPMNIGGQWLLQCEGHFHPQVS